MFFVSRVDHANSKAWVVDTEDGVESCMDYYELLGAVLNHGFDIKGVTLGRYNNSGSWFIETVRPYQPASSKTPLQLKLYAMYGVDITLCANELTHIDAPVEPLSFVPVVRLSDFSYKLSGSILNWCSPSKTHRLTLVLDSKLLDWSPTNFRVSNRRAFGMIDGGWIKGLGIKLDVRELKDGRKIHGIYKLAYETIEDVTVVDHSIIDFEDRKGKLLVNLIK